MTSCHLKSIEPSMSLLSSKTVEIRQTKSGASKQFPLPRTYQKNMEETTWRFFLPFLGWLRDLLERLSDLQLGDEKVTLNHLEKVS